MIDKLGRWPRKSVFFVLDIIGMISIVLRSSVDNLEPSRRRVFFALFKHQLYKTGGSAAWRLLKQKSLSFRNVTAFFWLESRF